MEILINALHANGYDADSIISILNGRNANGWDAYGWNANGWYANARNANGQRPNANDE
eukprot:CAMPEP_0117028194 /NCGR_PEP_ID=MMETSP0472-20121206/20519_1 /TAXON_ID=693140 ORGANISM="Tiarina fusus, Strain LIS" /NCGR_SAMPLE_ID=MMETSP0472 /ASSEMBLY_ACC=CAM_ASM_000603 /LENGTH=57 /DNA_ID=CAMNT_0004735609 /DNA_START=471 /DNA_END=644 /DNA_ORIENTATION=-